MANGKNIAYVRVSTLEQNEARQHEALQSYNIDKCFIEKASGKDTQRPKLQEMLEYIREDDTVYIEEFSRLGRSTADLLATVKQIEDTGAKFISLKEKFDTHTPAGKLQMTMMAAIAEFERAMILERQREGIAIAKREGNKKVSSTLQLPCPSLMRGLGVSFCRLFLHNDGMNILQNIFIDHYEELIYLTHPRPSVIENVNKMINCGDPSFGGAMYACSTCGNLKFVAFRCHSRFCPTCGNMYAIDRTTSMSFKLINCSHRHCVFTIPEELRIFFLEDRTLLNCLFSSVRSVILRMFHKENKSELFTPGFICVLHTFGRSLQWNPHIHCLISEGGIGNSSSWRTFKHFNYTFLRNAFCTALLNELEAKIGSSFKTVKSYIYKNCKEGFYVYAKPALCRPREVTKYISRYLGRPVIATKRIDKYDGDNGARI